MVQADSVIRLIAMVRNYGRSARLRRQLRLLHPQRAWLRRLDRGHHVNMAPLQNPDAPESVHATRAECLDQVQWLGDDGHRRSGAVAVNAAVGAALRTRLPLALYRISARGQERAYTWVSAIRYRLPGATPHLPYPSGRVPLRR